MPMLKPLSVWITRNWKILKELGIPDHFTHLKRPVCRSKQTNKQTNKTVKTKHGTMDWFQIGNGIRQGCILPPCLFNLHAEYIMQNAKLDKSQARVKMARKISTTSDVYMILV